MSTPVRPLTQPEANVLVEVVDLMHPMLDDSAVDAEPRGVEDLLKRLDVAVKRASASRVALQSSGVDN